MRQMPLFIYGTLRDAEIVSAVLGRPIAVDGLSRAEAPGFAAVYYPGHVYPALVARTGASAPGLLLPTLSPSERSALDAFEGEDYRQGTIHVLSHGAHHPALCYLPTRHIDADAPAWTLEEWTRRHRPEALAGQLREALAARRRATL